MKSSHSMEDGGTISTRASELDQREAELVRRETSLQSNSASTNGDLLPPNAAAGECYARVWVDPTYRTESEQIVTREASQGIEMIPAVYETVDKRIMTSAASSRLEAIPAQYGTKTETITVSEGSRLWKVGLNANDAPANQSLLNAASNAGINLDSAEPGMCFHEHYRPAEYRTETARVLVKEASENISIIPAKYEMVEERITVKEASTRLVKVDAVYETVQDRVLDKAAHTIWKKGTGPIQRIDESTGEIMCLVEVPASYKMVSRRVVKSGPSTQTIEIPAEYKTVMVRKMVTPASESRTPIAAQYDNVAQKTMLSDQSFVWHEVHEHGEPTETRTGNKICLTQTKPVYKTVTRTVVTAQASSRAIDIPAEYQNISTTRLVSAASEIVTEIPAEYGSVQKNVLVKDGFMDWRSILCDTNMSSVRITEIQRALANAGYNPGMIDGKIGASMMQAVNAYQKANGIPVDRYLNIATVKALGVSPQ